MQCLDRAVRIGGPRAKRRPQDRRQCRRQGPGRSLGGGRRQAGRALRLARRGLRPGATPAVGTAGVAPAAVESLVGTARRPCRARYLALASALLSGPPGRQDCPQYWTERSAAGYGARVPGGDINHPAATVLDLV